MFLRLMFSNQKYVLQVHQIQPSRISENILSRRRASAAPVSTQLRPGTTAFTGNKELMFTKRPAIEHHSLCDFKREVILRSSFTAHLW